MKNFLLKSFLFSCFFLGIVMSTSAQCDYSVTLSDSWGDGWNGNTIDITVNGITTNYTFDGSTGNPTGNIYTIDFTVNTGDAFTVAYILGTGSTFPTENQYEVFDADGLSLGIEGSILGCCSMDNGIDNPTGTSITGTAACPVFPPNCDAVLTTTTDLSISGDVSWSAATGAPTGYKITAGSTTGGIDLLDNVDVGDVLTTNVGALTGGTTYYITIVSYNTNGDATGCTEQTFTTGDVPDCPTLVSPTNGATDQISNITITWTAAATGGAADSYNIYSGTTSGALGFSGNVTGLAATFTGGLSFGTTYYWAIAPVNTIGENTACISSEFSFTIQASPPVPNGVTCTSGGTSLIVHTEEFDTQGSWTGDIGTADGDWKFGASTTVSTGTGASSPHSGSAFMYYESSGNVTNTASAISPAYDLSGVADEAELTFYMHAFGGGIGTLEVGVANSASGPFTNLFTWSGIFQTTQADPFYQVGLDVSAYIGGDLYIEFKQTGIDNFTGDMSIDLLEVTSCGCLVPSALGASNITANLADLSWTENGTATTWDIEWGAAGFTATGTPTITGITTNPYALSGLTSSTSYEFYVRADCDGTAGASTWTGPFNFTTLPDYCAGDAFYDNGGATGNYSDNSNETSVICPDNTGDIISITFNSFSVESDWDGLSIYDGDDATAPIIDSGFAGANSVPAGAYTGTNSPGTVTATQASGCLTFVFGSDSGTNAAGWEATVTCITPLVNDDCDAGAINLNGGGIAGIPTGTPIAATSTGATDSGIAPCTAGDVADDDVWFEFTTDTDGGDVTIDIVAAGITSPVCEVFVNCATTTALVCGTTSTVVSGTTPSTQYFVRVYDAATGFVGGAEERAAGGFTIAVSGTALPAELISFTGKAMDKYNAIKWETASEFNTAEFAIERSLNGRDNWDVIGTERAAGNSDAIIAYNFDDMHPVTQAYYRLRTIDLDGSAQTSNIVSIKRGATGFDVVLVAPNPTTAKTVVTFESLQDARVDAMVTDITGKVISTLTQDAIRGLNNMTIDLSNAPSGVYFLTMNNGVNNITRRIVKN